jgi:hypothetical protein
MRDHHAVALAKGGNLGAIGALDQHLDRPVRQLQQLQNARDGADRVQVARSRIVDIRTALGDQQDLLAARHRGFQRSHGLLASDEQRNDHMREDDHVAQRQDRQLGRFG